MKRHKAIRFFMIMMVMLLQLLFLAWIIKEKYEISNFIALVGIISISLLLLFGYRYLDLHHENYEYEKLIVVIWVPIGAVLCYLISIHLKLGPVIAAGFIGTAVSYLPTINSKSNYLKQLPVPIYCGTFVGMSSVFVIPSLGYVISAGIFAALFLMLSKNLFLGIGGKLGTIAFASVVFITFLNWMVA
ncbi:hypothetical transmembrane protein [Nonlabens ulvanivorans]|uniref:Hypothetical transmembrane protein n=1 Tax=Nonlabens ulvanivorans TaxID=906888 RepID=A0A090QE75_NONUL|nr:hypothetical protein [Nonlabens ulvanivorans]GAL01410.1 hypothetical transmembrane protein [Nonlabens ulvanivorans]